MIILDTNIVAEMMKQSPSVNVINWIDEQIVVDIFITAITVADISYGINTLPKGDRRDFLEDAFSRVIDQAFKNRILFFNEAAAHMYGKIMSHRKKIGKPLSILDGQIAAIALTEGAVLATRNANDFVECNLELINPFEYD